MNRSGTNYNISLLSQETNPGPSKTIGSCLICGGESTGKHYGIISCLGCKTFFRRAVVHQQDLNCKRQGKCILEKNARKTCRGCRYRKCLEMGMSKAALQPRRDLIGCRKVNRSIVKLLPQKNETNSFNNNTPNKPLISDSINVTKQNTELLNSIIKLTKLDRDIRTRKYNSLKCQLEMKSLAQQLENCGKSNENNKYISLPFELSPAVEKLKIMLAEDIAKVCSMELVSMIEWARTLPCFSQLPTNDQLTLLKRYAVQHLILEHGYYTSQFNFNDVWMISNGTCMPRNCNPSNNHFIDNCSEDRRWRQEKLYKQMTERCIDEVVAPLKRLKLMPEELLTLKISMLYQCGNHFNDNESTLMITEKSRKMIIEAKERCYKALFLFYKHIKYKNYEERFGNVILTISGIVSAAIVVQESYQIMRLFKIVPFDRLAEQLLFHINE
uniref:Nuclear hormone receptor family member nhr-19 (inferred by orthology to a C. elegans protein) n=1 Tax=Strongyloides venezuelensis TaxID=75913 RepID=A0A0K0FJN0_STRVS